MEGQEYPRGDWESDVHSMLAGFVIATLQQHLPDAAPFPVSVQLRPDTDAEGIYRNWLVVEVPDEARIAVVIERVASGVYMVRLAEDDDD